MIAFSSFVYRNQRFHVYSLQKKRVTVKILDSFKMLKRIGGSK